MHGASLGLSETGNAALSVSDGTAVFSGVELSGRTSLRVDQGQGAGPATTSYTYNGADELTAVSSPTISACYTYSGNGLRASATTDGVTQSFTWDQPARLLLSDGNNDYIYGPAGTPIEQVPVGGGSPVFVHTDELGSVRLLTSEAGTAIGTESYTPYGSVAASSGTPTSPFGYAGAYGDPTGLLYMVNRYYDPSSAQFTSVDPLVGLTQARYSYVDKDPVNATGPLGLCNSNAFSWSFWTSGNCLSGLVGGPDGGGGESFGGVVKSVAGIAGADAAAVGIVATGGIATGAFAAETATGITLTTTTEVVAQGDVLVEVSVETAQLDTEDSAAQEAADMARNVGLVSGFTTTVVDCAPGFTAQSGLNGQCLWDGLTTGVGFGASFYPGDLSGALIAGGLTLVPTDPFAKCG